MCDRTDAVTTHARLLAAGTTRRGIAAQVAHGSLTRVRRGVYAWAEACAAARAAAAHGGAIACVTAARHAGLWVLSEDTGVHVWLGGHGHAYAHEDCACVEHWDEAPPGDGSGTVSVPPILEQIRRCIGIEEFFVAFESALRWGLISAAGIAWLRSRADAQMRDAISFARPDADSGLESLLRWRLRPHGLRIRSQVTIVGVGTVDLLIGERLIVEADGRGNHDGTSRRHKDLVRDASAAMWGYITLRFDYAMIVHDWDAVERAIIAHVEAGSHVTRAPLAQRRG
jgi:very-short-patch-repair endonuclease